MKVLETSRLYLKEFSIEDTEFMYQLNLDPEVIKYTGDVAFKKNEEVTNLIKSYNHYKKYGFNWY